MFSMSGHFFPTKYHTRRLVSLERERTLPQLTKLVRNTQNSPIIKQLLGGHCRTDKIQSSAKNKIFWKEMGKSSEDGMDEKERMRKRIEVKGYCKKLTGDGGGVWENNWRRRNKKILIDESIRQRNRSKGEKNEVVLGKAKSDVGFKGWEIFSDDYCEFQS